MGSKAGWIVAGVLVLALAGIVTYTVWPKKQPQPAGAPQGPVVNITPEMLEKKEVGLPPTEIVGADMMPKAPGNAAEDYVKAYAPYNENRIALVQAQLDFDANSRLPSENVLRTLEQIDSLVSPGTAKARMELVRLRTENFYLIRDVRWASKLQDVAGALTFLGKCRMKKKEYAEAEKALKHEFIMGWHMGEERARVQMVSRGLAIQGEVLKELRTLYKAIPDQTGRQAAVDRYEQALKPVRESFWDEHDKRKINYLWRIPRNPRDIIAVAEGDKDRAWRVEAILVLGITKFSVNPQKDPDIHKKVVELIDKCAASSDPLEALAGKSAKEFTKPQFNTLGRVTTEPE